MFADFKGGLLRPLEHEGRPLVQRIFVGSEGLRGGWGCVLFILLTLGLTFLFHFAAASWLDGLRLPRRRGALCRASGG
jgi:hypothetical protein